MGSGCVVVQIWPRLALCNAGYVQHPFRASQETNGSSSERTASCLWSFFLTQVVLKQEDGTAQPSFVATHLAALAAEGTTTQDDIDDIRGSAGTIYGGKGVISNCSCLD